MSRKCVERPVKVLMSSLMRWSGLSMSPGVADVVVLALAQVAIQKTVREPAAPVVGERIAHVVVEGVHRHRHCHHHQAGAHGAPEAVHLLGGQGRCEFAGLVDQHHGELGLQHHQADQQGQQPPGHAFLVAQPVGARHAHELLPGRRTAP
jgi:hypothetical protein